MSTVATPQATQAAAQSLPVTEPLPASGTATLPDLMAVINAGNAQLQKEQEEFQKRWEQQIANIGGGGSGEITLSKIGQDEDIAEMVNRFGGQPLMQMMFLNWQMVRTAARVELMVQSIAAYLAREVAPETAKAVQAINTGGGAGE